MLNFYCCLWCSFFQMNKKKYWRHSDGYWVERRTSKGDKENIKKGTKELVYIFLMCVLCWTKLNTKLQMHLIFFLLINGNRHTVATLFSTHKTVLPKSALLYKVYFCVSFFHRKWMEIEINIKSYEDIFIASINY